MARDSVEIRPNTNVCSARLEQRDQNPGNHQRGRERSRPVRRDPAQHWPGAQYRNARRVGHGGIAFDSVTDIKVDALQRTTNEAIYAAGAVSIPTKRNKY
jgi:hypothetical protein